MLRYSVSPPSPTNRFLLGRERPALVWCRDGEPGRAAYFLHGVPGNAAVWSRLRAELFRRFEVGGRVWIDRPGYGNCAGNPVVAVEEQVRLLEQLACEEKDGPVLLVGHSVGCLVALEAALQLPQAFGGLILVAAPTPRNIVLDGTFRAFSRKCWPLLPEGWRQALNELDDLALRSERFAQRVRELRVPALFVWGRGDPFSGPGPGRVFYSQIQNRYRYHLELPGVHNLQRTHMVELATVVSGSLQAIALTGSSDALKVVGDADIPLFLSALRTHAAGR